MGGAGPSTSGGPLIAISVALSANLARIVGVRA